MLNTNESSIGRWISILYRYRQNFLSKRLETYHIGSGQHMFLLALANNDRISQEELSDYLKIDKATTAKAIRKLEYEGYVARAVDSTDKRAYQVFLTAKGYEVLPIIKAAVKEWERFITADLSESEGAVVEEILGKMARNAWQCKMAIQGDNK